jgi:hypothetical protein
MEGGGRQRIGGGKRLRPDSKALACRARMQIVMPPLSPPPECAPHLEVRGAREFRPALQLSSREPAMSDCFCSSTTQGPGHKTIKRPRQGGRGWTNVASLTRPRRAAPVGAGARGRHRARRAQAAAGACARGAAAAGCEVEGCGEVEDGAVPSWAPTSPRRAPGSSCVLGSWAWVALHRATLGALALRGRYWHPRLPRGRPRRPRHCAQACCCLTAF